MSLLAPLLATGLLAAAPSDGGGGLRLTDPDLPIQAELTGIRVGAGDAPLALKVRVWRDRWPGVVLRELTYEVRVEDAAAIRAGVETGRLRIRRGHDADLELPVRLAGEGALAQALQAVLAGQTPTVVVQGTARIRVLGIPREVPFVVHLDQALAGAIGG